MTAADETMREAAIDAAEDELAKAIGALPLPWGTPEIEPHLARITRAKDRLIALASAPPQGEAVRESVWDALVDIRRMIEEASDYPCVQGVERYCGNCAACKAHDAWENLDAVLATHPAPPRETRSEGDDLATAALAEARADKARLDWLEVTYIAHNGSGYGTASSLRAAIDAALTPTPEAKHG